MIRWLWKRIWWWIIWNIWYLFYNKRETNSLMFNWMRYLDILLALLDRGRVQDLVEALVLNVALGWLWSWNRLIFFFSFAAIWARWMFLPMRAMTMTMTVTSIYMFMRAFTMLFLVMMMMSAVITFNSMMTFTITPRRMRHILLKLYSNW